MYVDAVIIPDTLEDLVEKRAWLLERVDQYEVEIVQYVKDEFLKGLSARGIAKRAGVSHPTVLKWLGRSAVSKRNDTSGDES